MQPREWLWSNAPRWTPEENIELFIRAVLHRDMAKLLRGKVFGTQLEELKKVLFMLAYPTYDLEKRWSY
jgi:hypothetical protein